MKLIAVVLVSLSLALVVRGSQLRGYHVETFRHSADGQHLLLRTKREAQAEAVVCKYKKGDWSQCDSLVMVNIPHQLSCLYWGEEISSNPTKSQSGGLSMLDSFGLFVICLLYNELPLLS